MASQQVGQRSFKQSLKEKSKLKFDSGTELHWYNRHQWQRECVSALLGSQAAFTYAFFVFGAFGPAFVTLVCLVFGIFCHHNPRRILFGVSVIGNLLLFILLIVSLSKDIGLTGFRLLDAHSHLRPIAICFSVVEALLCFALVFVSAGDITNCKKIKKKPERKTTVELTPEEFVRAATALSVIQQQIITKDENNNNKGGEAAIPSMSPLFDNMKNNNKLSSQVTGLSTDGCVDRVDRPLVGEIEIEVVEGHAGQLDTEMILNTEISDT
eukprot:GHVR01058525.1.p1 GENE.GHVR01058525.1~~GHVR01058525.1.p1  ORF type:complete len:268 (+),score=51.82 GHVR01058525.1:52-855(+)